MLKLFDLIIVDKEMKKNVVPYFLSRLTFSTNELVVDDKLQNENIFSIFLLSPWFDHMANYLAIG